MKEYTIKTQITGRTSDEQFMYNLMAYGNVQFKDNSEILYDMRQIIRAESEQEAIMTVTKETEALIRNFEDFAVTDIRSSAPVVTGVHEIDSLNTDAFFETGEPYMGYTSRLESIVFEMTVHSTDDELNKLGSRITRNPEEGIESFTVSVNANDTVKLSAFIVRTENGESFERQAEVPLSPAEETELQKFLEERAGSIETIRAHVKACNAPIETSQLQLGETEIQYMEMGYPYLHTPVFCDTEYAKSLAERTAAKDTEGLNFYVESDIDDTGCFRSSMYLEKNNGHYMVQMNKQSTESLSSYVKENIGDSILTEYQNKIFEFENPNYDNYYKNDGKDTFELEV